MASPGPQVVWMPGGVRTEIHLGASDTDGALALIVDHPLDGWAVPPHRHLREAETIHVVAGHFAMEIGDETVMLGPGDTAHIPIGVVHSGRLLGGGGERIVTFTPGGVEAFFLELGSQHPSTSTDVHRILRSAAHFGWEFMDTARRR